MKKTEKSRNEWDPTAEYFSTYKNKGEFSLKHQEKVQMIIGLENMI